MFSPSDKGQNKGFTLIELLVVIAIIALLAVAATPAFNAISGSQGVGQGAYDVAGLLELARNEAVSRQTYVWVGFKNTNNSGNYGIVAGAVYSRDGSGTNINSTNLFGLSRAIHIRNVKLTNWGSLKQETRALFSSIVTQSTNAPTATVSTNSAGVNFALGKAGFTNTPTITFTPTGEAMLSGAVNPDTGFIPYIDVSFQQSRGGAVVADAEEASVVVDGATGNVRILRIK